MYKIAWSKYIPKLNQTDQAGVSISAQGWIGIHVLRYQNAGYGFGWPDWLAIFWRAYIHFSLVRVASYPGHTPQSCGLVDFEQRFTREFWRAQKLETSCILSVLSFLAV